MEASLVYLLKSSALLSIFLLAYQLLLRNDTSFQANRVFLFAGLLASLLLPMIEFTRIVHVESQALPLNLASYATESQTPDTPLQINWWQIGGIVYIIGMTFFLFRLILQVFSLLNIFRGGTRIRDGRNILITSEKKITPFSFFNYIMVNPALHTEEELRIVLQHEKVHVSQWHSADVLLSSLTAAVLWFNPLSWWYKRSLVQNLEFVADQGTIAASIPMKTYQHTLLKFSVNCYQPALANNFYQSLIKKRIIMLNKKPSRNLSLLKISFVIPFICAFMFIFNVSTQAQVTSIALTGASNSEASTKTVSQTSHSGNLLDKVGKAPLYIIRNRHYTTADLAGKSILLEGMINVISKEEATEKYGSSATDGAIIVTKGKIIDDFKASLKNIDDKDLPVRRYYIQVLKDAKPTYLDLKKSTETETFSGPTTNIIQISESQGKTVKVVQTDSIRPLYIVEGEVVAADFDLNSIDPDDIATVNVLKGDDAIESYGKKAKNGVIVIDLKEGREVRETSSLTLVFHDKNMDEKNVLYVLNGKVMDSSFKAYEIDAENIESLNILKGKSATDKYGEKAADGAIEITTKDKK